MSSSSTIHPAGLLSYKLFMPTTAAMEPISPIAKMIPNIIIRMMMITWTMVSPVVLIFRMELRELAYRIQRPAVMTIVGRFEMIVEITLVLVSADRYL